MISLFIKAFLGFVAAALLAWAIIPGFELWKLLAGAVGLSIVVPLVYPRIRGVKKGDGLLVIKGNVEPFLLFNASSCVALEDGKKGDTIGITLSDGTLAQAVVVDYEGFITPAKVRVMLEVRPKTADGVTVI
ncbi:MAG: hypothetical protein V1909_02940 [Candidatus Micrarchaeota archaeon]